MGEVLFLDMGMMFDPDWSGVPPHMSERDYLIWRRWQEERWKEYRGFFFDVAVGTPVEIAPGLSEAQAAGIRRSSVKRVDAVGVLSDRVRIIEVRPSASSSAGGAVLLYMYLLTLASAFVVPMEGMIITDLTDPDAERWFGSLKIRLETTGPIIGPVQV